MEEVLRGIDKTKCYINEIDIFSTSWKQHLVENDMILTLQGLRPVENLLPGVKIQIQF